MQTVAVIGAGTMGTGIALASALAGYDVILYDIEEAFVQRARKNLGSMMEKSIERGKLTREASDETGKRVTTTIALEDLRNSDLVIEAAVERLDIKHQIFSKLSEICREDCILSSNTSSLAITAI